MEIINPSFNYYKGIIIKCMVVLFSAFCLTIVVGLSNDSYAQTSRDNKIFEPKEKSKKSFGKSKRSENYYDQKVREYEDRMKDNEKKYQKMAREMEKPQYSDPSYFGHKKKPKKRPLNKRKFCEECGIVH